MLYERSAAKVPAKVAPLYQSIGKIIVNGFLGRLCFIERNLNRSSTADMTGVSLRPRDAKI